MADPAILWHGPAIDLTLNGAVRRGQPIRYNGTNYVAAASGDGDAEFIALGSGLSGDVIRASQIAELEDLDAPFTKGNDQYLSATAGGIADTAPASGALQVIGHAVSTSKAIINIRKSEWKQTVAAFSPRTNDGQALGTTALQWSDLFLATGGVINWNNGDTITHSANALTLAGIATLTLPATWAMGVAANVVTWTGRSITLTGANTTNNTTLTVTNTSNAAAASHSIVDVGVGGTTSTGDPQVRLTIPGGTSWYLGVDNSNNDQFYIGTGTIVGTNGIFGFSATTTGGAAFNTFLIDSLNVTLSGDSATGNLRTINLQPRTATLAGTTQITGLWDWVQINEWTISQSAGAVTVDKSSSISAIPVRATTSVTLTDSSAFRVVNGTASTGTLTNTYGLFVEALTRGTNNYGIWIATPTGTTAESIHVAGGNVTLIASVGVGAAPYAAQPASSIGTSGGVMIGASSTNNLFASATNGAGTATMYIGNASINVTSDMRLKKNIAPTIIDALSLLRKARVIDFDWDDPTNTDVWRRGRFTGMLAQETIDLFPWIVNAEDRECQVCRRGESCSLHPSFWHVEYEHLVPTLVRGIQQLDERLLALEERRDHAMNGKEATKLAG